MVIIVSKYLEPLCFFYALGITWEKEHANKVNKDLKQSFDFKDRYRLFHDRIKIIKENLEFFKDIMDYKKSS